MTRIYATISKVNILKCYGKEIVINGVKETTIKIQLWKKQK